MARPDIVIPFDAVIASMAATVPAANHGFYVQMVAP